MFSDQANEDIKGNCGKKQYSFSANSVCGIQIAGWTEILIMTLTQLLILLVIAAICGGVGQSLAGYDLGGCLVSIVVGFIGAWIGLWIAGKMGLPELFTINAKPTTAAIVKMGNFNWFKVNQYVFNACLYPILINGNDMIAAIKMDVPGLER